MLFFIFPFILAIKLWYTPGLESKPFIWYDCFTHYAHSANFVLGNRLLSMMCNIVLLIF